MDFENQPEPLGKESQDIESRVIFLEQRVEKILEELRKIREKPDVETIIVEFLEDLEKIRRDWKKEEEKINFIKSFAEDFNRKIEEIRKIDVKSFEENVERLNEAIKRLEEQKKLTEGIYETITSATKPLNERISIIENEIENLKSKPLGAEIDFSKINELDNRISSLEEDLRKLGTTISILPQSSTKEFEEKIKNLEKKISNLEIVLTSLKPAEIKEGIPNEITENIFNLRERIEQIEKKIKLLEESFERSLEEFKSSLQTAKEAKKAEVTSVLEDITKKISSLEEKFEIKKKSSPLVIE
jgi:chromosome segregation ATPase